MIFRREGDACLSSAVRKKSQYWFAFSADEKNVTLESSAVNDATYIYLLHQCLIIYCLFC